jgi:hypothetical protein
MKIRHSAELAEKLSLEWTDRRSGFDNRAEIQLAVPDDSDIFGRTAMGKDHGHDAARI